MNCFALSFTFGVVEALIESALLLREHSRPYFYSFVSTERLNSVGLTSESDFVALLRARCVVVFINKHN